MNVLYTKLSPEEALARLKETALAPPTWHENCGLDDSDERKGQPFARIKGRRFELGFWGGGWAPPRISGKIESGGETRSAKASYWCYGPLAWALSMMLGLSIAKVLFYFVWRDPAMFPGPLSRTLLLFGSTALFGFVLGYALAWPLWGRKTRNLLQFLRDTLEATERP